MIYEVTPLIGVGPVKLGMRRAEVRLVMAGDLKSFIKSPISKYETDAWHESSFQVFYGGDSPTVEYIELSRNSKIKAYYRSIDVFETIASTLIERISKHYMYDPLDPEVGYSYVFPKIEMSFWRPIKPISPNDEEGKYFSTVGIGIKGYYSENAT